MMPDDLLPVQCPLVPRTVWRWWLRLFWAQAVVGSVWAHLLKTGGLFVIKEHETELGQLPLWHQTSDFSFAPSFKMLCAISGFLFGVMTCGLSNSILG